MNEDMRETIRILVTSLVAAGTVVAGSATVPAVAAVVTPAVHTARADLADPTPTFYCRDAEYHESKRVYARTCTPRPPEVIDETFYVRAPGSMY